MIKDLTKGNPLKLIIIFALPVLISNIFQQFYHIADIMIVGRLLGIKALAAVGSSAPLIFMFLMISFGFTGGLTIITAQRFGAHDEKGIKSSVFHSFIASIVLCILISLFLVIFLKDLLILMNIPDEIMDQAYKFALVLGLSSTPIILFNLLSGFIRALGDAKTPLYFLIFSSILNIILNFIFIYYCKMGVVGSAIGSGCSITLTVIACIIIIAKRMPLLRIKLKDCRYNHKFMKEHLKIAIPMAINFSILSFSMMIIQSVCNSFGTEVIAGFTAAMRIEQISVQPLVAIGIAIATYTAQNYGATLIKRIRKGVRQSLFVCLIISIIISVSVRLFGTEMIASFIDNKDQNIIHIGKEYLLISSYFYFFLSCIFITRNTLQGMGNATFPLASSIIELIIRAYSAIYLANIIGYYGVFWAGPIAWIGGALVTLLGYFWIILHLNPKAIRQIYLRNKSIKKFSI